MEITDNKRTTQEVPSRNNSNFEETATISPEFENAMNIWKE